MLNQRRNILKKGKNFLNQEERFYDLEPQKVKEIKTKYRKIITKIPVPESIPVMKRLREIEPNSLAETPPVLWDRAIGFNVYDEYGNMWLDFTASPILANCGHSNARVKEYIIEQVNNNLLHTFIWPNKKRLELIEKILEIVPKQFDKVYLLSTGSETIENFIKLARGFGKTVNEKKVGIVSFEGAFHGRTLGAQILGGIPSLKRWLEGLDATPLDFYQVPSPNNLYKNGKGFDGFIESLFNQGAAPDKLAGVIIESYESRDVIFPQKEFIQQLVNWCKNNNVLLGVDEVQASFGRTGKMFAFEHYDIVPDVICCGKGITSSLPLSAVISRSEIFDVFSRGEMASTHTGNAVCCAAAIASITEIQEKGLVENSRKLGYLLLEELNNIKKENPDIIGSVNGKGLIAGLQFVKDGGSGYNPILAHEVVKKAVEKGLLLYYPVGSGKSTIRITPPLVLTEEALREGIDVLRESINEAKEAFY